jgi:hypothetical protein
LLAVRVKTRDPQLRVVRARQQQLAKVAYEDVTHAPLEPLLGF